MKPEMEERLCGFNNCGRRFRVTRGSPNRYCCESHTPQIAKSLREGSKPGKNGAWNGKPKAKE